MDLHFSHSQLLVQNACDSDTIPKRERGERGENSFYCCQFGWKGITQCCQKGSHRIIWFSVKSPQKALRPSGLILQSCVIVLDTLAAVAGWRGALCFCYEWKNLTDARWIQDRSSTDTSSSTTYVYLFVRCSSETSVGWMAPGILNQSLCITSPWTLSICMHTLFVAVDQNAFFIHSAVSFWMLLRASHAQPWPLFPKFIFVSIIHLPLYLWLQYAIFWFMSSFMCFWNL